MFWTLTMAALALYFSQVSTTLGTTRCRIVVCIQLVTLNTRHVPAGPYVGVLPLR